MYRVILADPPWSFKDNGTRLNPSYEGRGRPGSPAPYETMSLDAIRALRGWVRSIAFPDSFLFLWAPNSMVLEGQAQAVAIEWGFTPKQLIPWTKLDKSGKPKFGGGHYTRVCTEQLILCRRGKAKVKVLNEPGEISAQAGPRPVGAKHSSKPDESYRKIERLSDGPYIELFARRKFSESWDVWGNEV